MKREYELLSSLLNHEGYKLLEALWRDQGVRIQKARDRAASRSQESAWRYYAGQEMGFSLAVTQLQRALAEMEMKDEKLSAESEADKILRTVIGGEHK